MSKIYDVIICQHDINRLLNLTAQQSIKRGSINVQHEFIAFVRPHLQQTPTGWHALITPNNWALNRISYVTLHRKCAHYFKIGRTV